MCSQCRGPEHKGHAVHIGTFFINTRPSMLAGISAVKSVTYEAVQTATSSTLQSFDFRKCIPLVLVFPFSGGGTYDKVTNALRFLI